MRKWITAVVAAALVVGIGGYAIFLAAKPQDTPVASGTSPSGPKRHGRSPSTSGAKAGPINARRPIAGVEVKLYLRPKIGFCNCKTGVADDEELDRVSDIDLVGDEKSALAPGQPITVHWMKGRSRSYKVGSSAKPVLSLAFNDKCDVIVATVVAGNEPAAKEQAVLDFLNGDLVLHWAQQVLGL